MRENRTYGSEGGEAKSLPYPYPVESLCKATSTKPPSLHHGPARQREAHQHERRGDLGTADQDARRGLHLIPFIAFERSMPAAFAERADDAVQRRGEGFDVRAEMAERDQRQRRVEGIHLARDQFVLHVGEHPGTDEFERAVGVDRLTRRRRQRDEGGVAAAEIG